MKIKTLSYLPFIAATCWMLAGCENVQEFISNLSADKVEEQTQQVPPLPETVVYYPAQNPVWAKLDVGTLTCELGKKLHVRRADVGNSIDINWQGKEYTLHNVKTQSGAYRYEDPASGLVFIQIPAKVELLNSKLGQRVADECRP